jgi:putative NIF3 family GTP cyclohydrolase 1 type 2
LKEISTPIDLFITGEMSHHELLDAAAKNINVVMLNHSNSERGYLKYFSGILKGLVSNGIEVLVSETDEDPLTTY